MWVIHVLTCFNNVNWDLKKFFVTSMYNVLPLLLILLLHEQTIVEVYMFHVQIADSVTDGVMYYPYYLYWFVIFWILLSVNYH